MQKVKRFIDNWTNDDLGIKSIFISFFQDLLKKEMAEIEFHERPGISYSLRGINKTLSDRPLFVMIDVIDDDPRQRWLSVCFYSDTITDIEQLGDVIPGGLLGSDGYCFDITELDASLNDYVGRRIQEAYEKSCLNGK
jgi:hypothetical protein